MDISTSTKNEKGEKVSVDVTYDMPPTLADKVRKFGEEVVNDAAEASLVIGIQNAARRMLVPTVDKSGKVVSPAKSKAEIQAAINSYSPDVRSGAPRVSQADKVKAYLASLTPEQRKALLAEASALKPVQPARAA
jgi:hypothetical protein